MPAPRPPHPEGDDRLEAELVLFVDGELAPERAAAIEASAAADAELRNRIALVRAGRDRLRAAAAATEAPFELRRRIDVLIARPPRARRRWRPLAVLAGAAASLGRGRSRWSWAEEAPAWATCWMRPAAHRRRP